MPESPRYLVTRGKLDEAKKAFETIAWWNRKELIWDERLYTKGEVGEKPAVLGSESSVGTIQVIEIHGFPLIVKEEAVRSWLSERINID